MKKTLSIVLALVLVVCFAFTACTNNAATPAPETASETKADDTATTDIADKTIGEANTEVEPIEFNILFHCWGFADTLSMGYQKSLNSISDGLMTLEQPIKINWEWAVCMDPDEELNNTEALLEKGLDGVICLYMTQAIVDWMTEHELIFGGYTTFGDDIDAYAATSPYYIGTIHEGFAKDSEDALKYAVEDLGCKNILLVGPAPGLYNHDCRYAKWAEMLKDYPDVKTYEIRDDTVRADVVNNALTVHPETDCIIDTSALGGWGEATYQAIATNGGIGNIKYLTCDFFEQLQEAFDNGTLKRTSSGTQGSVTHIFVAIVNRLMGTPLSDKAEIYDWPFLSIYSYADYEDFNKYCIGDVPMITFEDYTEYFKWLNPDATNEDYYNLAYNLTLDTIRTRHAKYFE